MKRGKLLRYRNGTWIIGFEEEEKKSKQKPAKPTKNVKKDKKMSNCFFPKISFFQKVENWLQNKAYWLNVIFAVLFGVSLALNIFQYKVIQFYKKIQETIIINGGF
tara:strand:- start:893 stop:1210 length:318 start_codon:yes stop_codon:yes gene_type:complete